MPANAQQQADEKRAAEQMQLQKLQEIKNRKELEKKAEEEFGEETVEELKDKIRHGEVNVNIEQSGTDDEDQPPSVPHTSQSGSRSKPENKHQEEDKKIDHPVTAGSEKTELEDSELEPKGGSGPQADIDASEAETEEAPEEAATVEDTVPESADQTDSSSLGTGDSASPDGTGPSQDSPSQDTSPSSDEAGRGATSADQAEPQGERYSSGSDSKPDSQNQQSKPGAGGDKKGAGQPQPGGGQPSDQSGEQAEDDSEKPTEEDGSEKPTEEEGTEQDDSEKPTEQDDEKGGDEGATQEDATEVDDSEKPTEEEGTQEDATETDDKDPYQPFDQPDKPENTAAEPKTEEDKQEDDPKKADQKNTNQGRLASLLARRKNKDKKDKEDEEKTKGKKKDEKKPKSSLKEMDGYASLKQWCVIRDLFSYVFMIIPFVGSLVMGGLTFLTFFLVTSFIAKQSFGQKKDLVRFFKNRVLPQSKPLAFAALLTHTGVLWYLNRMYETLGVGAAPVQKPGSKK